jgi:hypothetical protein
MHGVLSQFTVLVALLIDTHRDQNQKRNAVTFINHADRILNEAMANRRSI